MKQLYTAIFFNPAYFGRFKKDYEDYGIYHKEGDRVSFKDGEYQNVYIIDEVIYFPDVNKVVYVLKGNGTFKPEHYYREKQ